MSAQRAPDDRAEGKRFAFGCGVVLVAIGILILAFLAGIYSTHRAYRDDPEGFEKRLKEEYRQMEEKARENETGTEPGEPVNNDQPELSSNMRFLEVRVYAGILSEGMIPASQKSETVLFPLF